MDVYIYLASGKFYTSKISQFDVSIVIQKNIATLNISMDDTSSVEVL